MLRVFKGDDTAFAGASTLRVTIGTALPLAGCTADFELCGVVKRIPDVSTGTFEVDYTAEETAAMPLGVHFAAVRVYDPQGRRRTSVNTLRVEVTDRVDLAYAGANAVVVDGSLVTKGVIDDGQGVPDDLPEDYTPNEMRAFLNRVAALLRNSIVTISALAVMAVCGASGDVAPLGTVRATSNVVTRVDLSGLAASTDVYTKAETDARIVELAPTPTEIDPTVPAWAKADTPPASGLTTNDVCAIITNEVVTAGEWRISPISPEAPMPPNAMIQWTSYDATDNPYTRQTGWDLPYTVGWFLIFGVSHEKLDVFSYDSGTDPDALNLEMSSGDTGYSVTATRAERRNALGLVVAADLPDVKPAAQLLLKGEDGNVYVVKVDSDGVLRYYRQEDN